jgi:hypothetical protein
MVSVWFALSIHHSSTILLVSVAVPLEVSSFLAVMALDVGGGPSGPR